MCPRLEAGAEHVTHAIIAECGGKVSREFATQIFLDLTDPLLCDTECGGTFLVFSDNLVRDTSEKNGSLSVV